MEQAADPSRPGWPSLALGGMCLAGAAFFYLIAQLSIADLGASDAAGNGMTAGFGFLAELVLWLLLAGFLAAACRRSGMPQKVLALSAVLTGASAIACLCAIGLMQRPTALSAVPTILPLLAVAFGLWVRFTPRLAAERRVRLAAAIGATALPLIGWAAVEQARWDLAAPQRAAEMEAAHARFEREQAEAREARHRALKALGPDDSLDRYVPFFADEWPEEAFAKARRVRSRQADAERLMAGPTELFELRILHRLDLAASPRLCASYRARLDAVLAQGTPANPNWRGVPSEMEGEHDNVRWMLEDGCDLKPQVQRWRAILAPLVPGLYAPNHLERLDALLVRLE